MDSLIQKITNDYDCGDHDHDHARDRDRVHDHDGVRYIYDHLNANGYDWYYFNDQTYLVLLVTFDFNYCQFD